MTDKTDRNDQIAAALTEVLMPMICDIYRQGLLDNPRPVPVAAPHPSPSQQW